MQEASLQQECIRLLTAWAEETVKMTSLGTHPLAVVQEMGEGAGIRTGTSKSKPLIHYISRDYKVCERYLRVVRHINPSWYKHLTTYASEGCSVERTAAKLSRGRTGTRKTVDCAMACFVTCLYLGA